jgi:cysteine--tRNA ligase
MTAGSKLTDRLSNTSIQQEGSSTEPSLRLYNSMTQKFEPVAPTITPGLVSIYLCGATVQGSPHIGHMRSSLVFDVMRRWLERGGTEVRLIRNVTDIDDKILAKSSEAGLPWWQWAQIHEREFTKSYESLDITPPTYEPRATGHIPEMIDLVQKLIDKGHAYVSKSGSVYFDVSSFPEYGQLTHQGDTATNTSSKNQTDQTDSCSSDNLDEKKDPRDFALWKAAKPSEPEDASWDSPWGRGRPGWHLECSAMAHRYLGRTFDIHGGGIDLRFPHHENELAQSCAAGYESARHWVHNAWVTIKGEKMSKSMGNSLFVSDLVDKYGAAPLRLALVSVHYRSVIEFSEEMMSQHVNTWKRLSSAVVSAYKIVESMMNRNGLSSVSINPVDAPLDQIKSRALSSEFASALNNDLNVPAAMTEVFKSVKHIEKLVASLNTEIIASDGTENSNDSISSKDSIGILVNSVLTLRAMLDVLGLDPLSEPWKQDTLHLLSDNPANSKDREILSCLIEQMIEERQQARKSKNWGLADRIRSNLAESGIIIEDTPSGTRWKIAE